MLMVNMFCYTTQISHMSCPEPCVNQCQRESSSYLHVQGTNLPVLKEELNIYVQRNSLCSKRQRLNSEHRPVAWASFQKWVRKEFKALVLLTAQVTGPTSIQSPSCASWRKKLSCPSTQCQERIHRHKSDVEGATITAPQCFLAVGNKLQLFTSKTLPSPF